jgi:hypothetical protein
MKKIIFILLGCTIFYSFNCKNKQEVNDLKIEILNTDIMSSYAIKDKNFRNVIDYENYIYDSVPVNKVNIKLTNTGTKKYVLFIGKDFDDAEKLIKDNISFNILKENEIFKPSRLPVAIDYTNKHFYSRKLDNEIDRELLKQELNEKYLKEKISVDKIRFHENMNYIVIHPGESKFFSYYKTLPIFYDYNLYASFYFYKFKPNENYFVQVSLKNQSETSKKNFTTNQIKEIEANGYTIFNGTINSNKVPIKFVDMNKE